jgi:HK97 family phage portal protein
MGILGSLLDVGSFAASTASGALGFVGEELSKAARDEKEGDLDAGEEGNERATPGKGEDTPENAPVPTDQPTEDPKALFWDPFAMVEQMGFKERSSSVSYQTLRRMVWQMPIVQAIIKTRVTQVSAFAKPQKDRYSMGFKIQLRDKEATPSKADKDFMQDMETFITRTGVTDNPRDRDSFSDFLKKFTRDSLTLDQACAEIVPNALGQPAEFYATDSATMRLASNYTPAMGGKEPQGNKYVQIYDQMIIAEYASEEMIFMVRNPATDLRLAGYGQSELEMLVTTITHLLYGVEFNKNAFTQGSLQKGMINFKGTISDKQLRSFRRMWYSAMSSVHNAWKTPIVNSDEVSWVKLQDDPQSMGYQEWIDWNIKVACAVFNIAPEEVNFDYGKSGQKSAMQDNGNKDKIIESKEKGLRPLLDSIAADVNQYIVWPINEGFEFAFVGLDAMTRNDLADLTAKRVKSTWTVDELRAEEDLPPLPDGKGEVILDAQWLQWAQLKEGGGEEGVPGGDEEGGFPGADDEGEEGDPEEAEDEDGWDAMMQAEMGNDEGEEEPTEEKEPVEKSLRRRTVFDMEI